MSEDIKRLEARVERVEGELQRELEETREALQAERKAHEFTMIQCIRSDVERLAWQLGYEVRRGEILPRKEASGE